MSTANVTRIGHDLTAAGRLSNLSDWDEQTAAMLAQQDGITLTEGHWEVIHFMREFYQNYNISPIRKLLLKGMRRQYGAEKATGEYIDRLFPGNVTVQGTKIAGLPEAQLDAQLENERYGKAGTVEREGTSTPLNTITMDGREYQLYPFGNLLHPHEWSEAMSNVLAEKEGITLSAEHWEVIHYLREFYFEFGIVPMVRLLMKHMRERAGPDKAEKEYLYRLFPKGPSSQGSRIAGLPRPQGCIDE